ncbi:MAG TPA: HAD family phosphatase [Candidatus Saccharimonadales bacterium]|nr:HAD family phosphatase [Candidatus Saccharimonadales bacterium]
MSSKVRPFAVFDIDGTVIRWQLYHAVSDRLARDGLIDDESFERVRRTRMDWKRRTGEDSFQEYEMELVKVFDEALKGMSVAGFEKAAHEVFEEYKDQVYTYTRDLIHGLKRQGYLLFAISGSPDIIVKKMTEYYGFDDFAATTFPSEAGRFTGAKDLSVGKKPRLLQRLIDKHGTGPEGSLGVGDSEGDIDMLAMVERPIAFNPSKRLFNHAREQGWEIILERKNVVYELDLKSKKYVLRT